MFDIFIISFWLKLEGTVTEKVQVTLQHAVGGTEEE